MNDKHIKKKYRTKRRTKDLDQIEIDLLAESIEQLTQSRSDPDKPGGGLHYCVHCA